MLVVPVLVLDRKEGLEMFRIEVAAQRRPIGAKNAAALGTLFASNTSRKINLRLFSATDCNLFEQHVNRSPSQTACLEWIRPGPRDGRRRTVHGAALARLRMTRRKRGGGEGVGRSVRWQIGRRGEEEIMMMIGGTSTMTERESVEGLEVLSQSPHEDAMTVTPNLEAQETAHHLVENPRTEMSDHQERALQHR